MSKLKRYLQDPFLETLYDEIRGAGPVRSISVDITHKCNLRCTGCYFFSEGMDRAGRAGADTDLAGFIEREQRRGTNFVTIVGGEPALVPDRLRALHANFRVNVATNGVIRIPRSGLEDMPIGIAVWGDHDTDAQLRGNGRRDYFSAALENYRDDPRAFWYYTVAPGCAHEIEAVVEQCVANGQPVLFNYYSDVDERGGILGYRQGFEAVRQEIDRMIDRYPDRIFTTRYFNRVVTTGRLFDQHWGFDACTNLSNDYPGNRQRLESGAPSNPHFRAYNADFTTSRRCCTGTERDCASCFDTWEHFSWIMLHLRKHLGSRADFVNWLTTMYVFYLVNRLVDYETGMRRLPEIQARLAANSQPVQAAPVSHDPSGAFPAQNQKTRSPATGFR
jgi:hypothetical protein